MECPDLSPTRPPTLTVPFFCLSLTLPSSTSFYPKLHFPSGGLGPSILEKKRMFFVIFFLAGFSLCSAVVQECMMGKWVGNSFLAQFNFFYSVDQFQQGKGEGMEGEGE